MKDYSEIKNKLDTYEQGHLLQFYDELTEEEKESLLNQIEQIDFDLIKELYKKAQTKSDLGENKLEPVQCTVKEDLNEEELSYYQKLGDEVISSGKYAVVIMAGGQGTRLGHEGPKGTYDMGLPSGKSLFEILCDGLISANKKYNVVIPWYIMTSKENDHDTRMFFEKANYFGYPKEEIKFFIQGELPMISVDGKILLENKGLIKVGADGHGGIFNAMIRNNVLAEMKDKGIEWIFTAGIDNPLLKIVDPILVGLSLDKKVSAASRTLVKNSPTEKVGVFCKRNGRPAVIEYIFMPEELANLTDENGQLVYSESHVMFNMFHISIMEEISKTALPYYAAFKATDYLNENGEIAIADKPNAYKFESFIFDAFSMLDDMALLRVKREDEFAPIKNKEGVDSPETARELYINYMNRIGEEI